MFDHKGIDVRFSNLRLGVVGEDGKFWIDTGSIEVGIINDRRLALAVGDRGFGGVDRHDLHLGFVLVDVFGGGGDGVFRVVFQRD